MARLADALAYRGVPPGEEEWVQVPAGTKKGTYTECEECEASWTSHQACHCSNCHRTFGGRTAFDMHQNDSEPTICYQPETVGLVLKANRMWGQTETDDLRRLRELTA